MNPSGCLNARLWPNMQKARRHDTAWQRDGFGVPNCLRAKAQQHTARAWRSDTIKETFCAGDASADDSRRGILALRPLPHIRIVKEFL
jgi:hypothetical protein